MILPVWCPECRSGQVRRRYKIQVAECCHCRFIGHASVFLKEKPKADEPKQRIGGSGIVAGRIEIGRGSNWKAGIV